MTTQAIPYFMPPWSGPTMEEVEAAKALIERSKEAGAQQIRDTLIKCTSQTPTGPGCGHLQRIGDTVYLQTYWYTPPHGCTGGDYWNAGEGQFRCNECGHLNRLYDTPKLEEWKRHFLRIEEKHDRC